MSVVKSPNNLKLSFEGLEGGTSRARILPNHLMVHCCSNVNVGGEERDEDETIWLYVVVGWRRRYYCGLFADIQHVEYFTFCGWAGN